MKGQKINWQECQRLGKELAQELKAKAETGSYDFVVAQLMEELEDYPQSAEQKKNYIEEIVLFFLMKSPSPYFEVMGFRLAFVKSYHKVKSSHGLFGVEMIKDLYCISETATKYEESLQVA